MFISHDACMHVYKNWKGLRKWKLYAIRGWNTRCNVCGFALGKYQISHYKNSANIWPAAPHPSRWKDETPTVSNVTAKWLLARHGFEELRDHWYRQRSHPSPRTYLSVRAHSARYSRGWRAPLVPWERELPIATNCAEHAERWSSGKAAERRGNACTPRSFDIRSLDHWYPPAAPSRRIGLALLHPWLPIIERYCVTLRKLFHGVATRAAEDSAAHSRSHTYRCTRGNVFASRICGKCDSCRGTRAVERTTLTNCDGN